MTEFLITFLLLVVFGSIICLGWFLVTRGEEIEQVDGSKKKVGALLQYWQFFWEMKSNTPKRIMYKNKVLFFKSQELISYNLKLGYKGKFDLKNEWIEVDGNFADIFEMIEAVSKVWMTMEQSKIYPDVFKLYLWEEQDRYVFPEIIRSPLASCVTCFSSVYGTTIYFTFLHFSKQDLFAWASRPEIVQWITWFAYILSVAYLNTFLYKILEHHKVNFKNH